MQCTYRKSNNHVNDEASNTQQLFNSSNFPHQILWFYELLVVYHSVLLKNKKIENILINVCFLSKGSDELYFGHREAECLGVTYIILNLIVKKTFS
jgi:hypothetical protein